MRTSFDEISGLPPPIARLLDELMQDHAFGREVVEPLCKWFTALDREGDDNPDALACMQAFAMIAAQPYPARERFEWIDRIATLPRDTGMITVTIKRRDGNADG
jgi:hypothetical protein